LDKPYLKLINTRELLPFKNDQKQESIPGEFQKGLNDQKIRCADILINSTKAASWNVHYNKTLNNEVYNHDSCDWRHRGHSGQAPKFLRLTKTAHT